MEGVSFTRALAVSAFPNLTLTEVALRLLSVLLLIAINAFFVTAEFSMVTAIYHPVRHYPL